MSATAEQIDPAVIAFVEALADKLRDEVTFTVRFDHELDRFRSFLRPSSRERARLIQLLLSVAPPVKETAQ